MKGAPMNLASRIRHARKRRDLSQAMLAHYVGVSRGAVANWESVDGSAPSAARLASIAEVSQVRFEWLATGRGEIAFGLGDGDVPALDAELVTDEYERKLLRCFRFGSKAIRNQLLSIINASR